MEPSQLLETALEIIERFAPPLAILAVYLAWKAVRPRLRTKLSEILFGDSAREWPEIEGLLMPVISTNSGRADCQALFNHVLIDRPSKTTQGLLAAYGITAERIVLEPKEDMLGELRISEGVLKVAIFTCFHARASRPSPKVLDHSDMIVWMFKIPSLAQALGELGLTRLKVTYYLSCRSPLPASEDPGPIESGVEQAWIQIHNDRFSTEDLVNRILAEIFGHDAKSAADMTNDVQRFGQVSLGPYAPDDATVRLRKALAMARAAEEPLRLSLTTEDPGRLATTEHAADTVKERNRYAVPESTRF